MTQANAVPVIRTRGLGKVYSAGSEAEVVALKGVDLRIDRGEFVAIMGPSGSGKSTLMNLIGCLDTPTSGSYECDGVDVSTLDKEALAALRRDKIGFVFQGFHLLTRMDAVENVAMPMGYARIPPAERRRRALEALEAVGLAEKVQDADLVITGEGRMDAQSVHGKTPIGVAHTAKAFGKPVIAIVGCLREDYEVVYAQGIDAVFPIIRQLGSLEEILQHGRDNLVSAAQNVARIYQMGISRK